MLQLDKMEVCGRPLKIGRPKGYEDEALKLQSQQKLTLAQTFASQVGPGHCSIELTARVPSLPYLPAEPSSGDNLPLCHAARWRPDQCCIAGESDASQEHDQPGGEARGGSYVWRECEHDQPMERREVGHMFRGGA